MDHAARRPSENANAEWSGLSTREPGQQGSVWNPEQQQHRSIQEPVVALAVRAVVLVPPDFLGFFFENQQSRRFGQGLFFEPEILLQLSDTLAF